jgi:hypothetical protein
MINIDFIANYYLGTKAYTIFMLKTLYNVDEKNYIENKDYQLAAQVGFIANIMLSIKEELVENTGNLIYESKLYEKTLEETVENISTKTKDGYKIDDYTFKDAPTLVAVLRNKLGHGDFTIDYKKGTVVLHIEDQKVSISVDKLTTFIINANYNFLMNTKTNEYKRNFIMFTKLEKNRKKPITTEEEAANIIRQCENIEFSLKRQDDKELEPYEINSFNEIVEIIKKRECDFELIKYYKELLKNKKYIMKVEYTKLNKYKDINKLLPLIKNSILSQTEYDYKSQVLAIVKETQRKVDENYNITDVRIANIKNLIMLRAMKSTRSTDINDLKRNIANNYKYPMYFNYDNLATAVISNFNSLFAVPYDKLYKKTPEEQGLDFSKLNLNALNIIHLEVEEDRLKPKKDKETSLEKEVTKVETSLEETKNNLAKVPVTNTKAITTINNNITNKNNYLNQTKQELQSLKQELQKLQNYYQDEELYMKNRTIIAGIRNSIAHGTYEIVPGPTIEDAKLIFTNIYEEKLVLKAEITVIKFLEMMDNNLLTIQQYLNDEETKQNNQKVI